MVKAEFHYDSNEITKLHMKTKRTSNRKENTAKTDHTGNCENGDNLHLARQGAKELATGTKMPNRHIRCSLQGNRPHGSQAGKPEQLDLVNERHQLTMAMNLLLCVFLMEEQRSLLQRVQPLDDLTLHVRLK